MTDDATEVHLHSAPKWLVEWISAASRDQNRHSLSIAIAGEQFPQLARNLASYLNEFDSECHCNWRPFDHEMLRSLAGDRSSWRILLGDEDQDPEVSEEKIARRLVEHGSAILQARDPGPAIADLETVFRVLLHHGDPPAQTSCHMTINLHEVPFERLTCIIADSFLGWRPDQA